MRADSAELLASRAPALPLSERIVVAEVVPEALPVSRVEWLDFSVTGGRVAPSPGPPILPCPLWARRLLEPGASRQPNATKRMIDRFMTTPSFRARASKRGGFVARVAEKHLIGPHVPHNRAQIDSNAEGNRVERIMNTPGVPHLQLERPGR